MIHTLDDVVFERVRRAIPLLSLDLNQDEVLRYLLPLNRHAGFNRDVTDHMQPVYDRAISRWLAPVHPDRF
ncbi:MAG TPA: hypothetical protein DCW29_19710 [Janthinobacterium sp.]|nr:hypothetical protein [Janthinobacterium sp.]